MTTKMTKIIIDDIEIETIKKNIKNLYLSVHPPAGRVRLSAPKHMDQEAIRLFAISKLSWIKKQQKKFNQQKRLVPKKFLPGESHYFMGQPYLLNIIETKEKQRVELRDKKYMDLYLRPGHTKEKRERILREWYRRELKALIPEYIEKWQDVMEVTVNDWGVKRMKTKWGSCNIKAKRIWLNLGLAQSNRSCLEYVIVHEMVHLLERHHNQRFKDFMDEFLPNWKSLRDQLNQMTSENI